VLAAGATLELGVEVLVDHDLQALHGQSDLTSL
jgi:hypothetical protein